MKLAEAQAAIQAKSEAASEMVLELVGADQQVRLPCYLIFSCDLAYSFPCVPYQKFVGMINQRFEKVQETVGKVLPVIKEPGQYPFTTL